MIKNIFNYIITFPIIILIRFYQLFFSPILKSNCRYLPTCSEYALESLKQHGPLTGGYYSIRRILSCHPLGGKGFDPVKKIIKKEINK